MEQSVVLCAALSTMTNSSLWRRNFNALLFFVDFGYYRSRCHSNFPLFKFLFIILAKYIMTQKLKHFWSQSQKAKTETEPIKWRSNCEIHSNQTNYKHPLFYDIYTSRSAWITCKLSVFCNAIEFRHFCTAS